MSNHDVLIGSKLSLRTQARQILGHLGRMEHVYRWLRRGPDSWWRPRPGHLTPS